MRNEIFEVFMVCQAVLNVYMVCLFLAGLVVAMFLCLFMNFYVVHFVHYSSDVLLNCLVFLAVFC